MVTVSRVLVVFVIVTSSRGFHFNKLINSVSTTNNRGNSGKEIYDGELLKKGSQIVISQLIDHISGAMEFPNLLANLTNSDIKTMKADYKRGLATGYAHLGIRKLSRIYGYPLKEYKVVTEDGYKLTMFRIRREGPAVFVMHGLLGSCDDYMTAGPGSGLAYLLADSGYDVWLGNARGTKHSRSNIKMKPSNPKFWDFSWHEIGMYDLPAMIDYILKKTGQNSLVYIGHSQGTTTFYIMASERPEYNAKVSLMISLAPSAFVSHMKSPLLRLLAVPADSAYPLAKLIGVNEFLPDSVLTQALMMLLCGTGISASIFCSNLLFLIVGFDYAQLNVTSLPVIYGHVPSGAATKQVIHYAQGITSGQFKQFDYGPAGNKHRYGSRVPPRYRLENIVAPMSIFYSDADWVSNPIDVERLRGVLPNVVDYYKVPYPFNHVDYYWAKDFKKYVYDHIEELLRMYVNR